MNCYLKLISQFYNYDTLCDVSLAASLDQECTVEILLPLGAVAMGDLISILFCAARQDLHPLLGFFSNFCVSRFAAKGVAYHPRALYGGCVTVGLSEFRGCLHLTLPVSGIHGGCVCTLPCCGAPSHT